ncbi:MAG: anhydro-N-acetylmuramic acid kinase [Pseudomonadota bacterium]
MAKIKTAIGLMSGTSMDGIDIALIRTDGIGHIEFGPTHGFAYASTESQAIANALEDGKAVTHRDDRPGKLKGLDGATTYRHIAVLIDFMANNQLEPEDVDVVGLHGQTVLHRPDIGLTVQLGDGALVAQKVGIPVVWDMRANDMANGGQGAPLVPVFHQALARQLGSDETVAFVNIGGISNVTFVRPGQSPVAFDCGPGNALLDQWVQAKTNRKFDQDGALALRGVSSRDALDAYLRDPFFEQTAPKSLDRNDFSLSLPEEMSAEDGAATLAALTAHGIFQAQVTAGIAPKRWIISGGGARNAAIMRALRDGLPEAEVSTADEAGFDTDMMEAQCWAYLAVRSLRGLPLTFPTTTGCEEACTGGILSLPASH